MQVKKRDKNRFQPPTQFKKLFLRSGIVFGICVMIAMLCFAAGAANQYLVNHEKFSIVAPVSGDSTLADFQKKLSQVGLNYQSISESTSGATITVQISADTTAYLSATKDVDWQVSSLQEILSRLTIENSKPQYVDLRYDKPIVKF